MGIHHKGNGACILVEGVEHIGAAADAQIITGWFVLVLQNVLGHHPEGGHIAQLPDVCLGQGQGDAHAVLGQLVTGIFGSGGLALGIGLVNQVGAAVSIIVFQSEQNVLGGHLFAVTPVHSFHNGVDPGLGILGFVGGKQRMIAAGGVLVDQGHGADTAGQHFVGVLAAVGNLNDRGGADGDLFDGSGTCCDCQHGNRQCQNHQDGKQFFHRSFSFATN